MKSISLSRLNHLMLLAILSVVVLVYGQEFLVPLFFGILLSMLLLPVCNKLEKWGIGRVGSTLIGILIILVILSSIVGIIAAQGASLSDDIPKIQEKFQQFKHDAQDYITENYGIGLEEQESYAKKGMENMKSGGGGVAFVQKILSGTFGFLTGLVLALLYFFFLMWKREKYHEFILRLVKPENREEVAKALNQITHVSSQYLIGRLISMTFLAVIYMVGFSIVGLPDGLLIALVAVLPTIVPYVGAFIGGFFPLIMAVVGGSTEMILPIAIILVVAQVIDNNIIEPMAEGESMDISPIFTIIAIVVGELIWGVAGMILFIPLFAILKIICDHIPSLHPYSYLLENELHEPKWIKGMKKFFTRKK